jgi:hypothetical protein
VGFDFQRGTPKLLLMVLCSRVWRLLLWSVDSMHLAVLNIGLNLELIQKNKLHLPHYYKLSANIFDCRKKLRSLTLSYPSGIVYVLETVEAAWKSNVRVLFPRAAEILKVELYPDIAATPTLLFVVNFTLDGRV